MLGITISGLVAGAILHWAGLGAGGNLVWIVTAGSGSALSLYSIVDTLLRGRLGVDIIALLALVGAVAVGEYLAGAVISVMLASGRALEGWASGRARRELEALLERAPKSAHRYEERRARPRRARRGGPGRPPHGGIRGSGARRRLPCLRLGCPRRIGAHRGTTACREITRRAGA